MKTANRLRNLRLKLIQQKLEAILISQPENRYYLSGFNGSSGLLLITQEKAVLATDFRYTEQAGTQAPDYEVFQTTGDIATWFPDLITGHGIGRLGVEAGNVTLATHRQLIGALKKVQPHTRLVAVNGLVESLRVIKEPEEIELITRAAEITDDAIEYIENIIKPGITEIEIAWEIEKFMREKGSQPLPFGAIVASGPNSAMAHAMPTSKKIERSEPVVIDIGAKIGGYSADLTRTIYLGTPDDTYKKVYGTVLNAQTAALENIKEGRSGNEVDNIAREIIEQAGYGKAFGHSLGHGVGLEPHEQPRLGPKSTDRLTTGMVFTVEPGIYLTGWGGVRIEDLLVIENGKTRILSKSKKEGST